MGESKIVENRGQWYQVYLSQLESTLSVKIERTTMKTCRLRVLSGDTVILSVPKSISEKWISSFLDGQKDWLSRKIAVLRKNKGCSPLKVVTDKAQTTFLGEVITLSVVQRPKREVCKSGAVLHIGAPDLSEKVLFNLYDGWWRQASLDYLEKVIDQWWGVFEKRGIDRPKIGLRKMKTLWGSCHVGRGSITFNQYLTMAEPECVEYVVVHELVHLIHPNHSQDYYQTLTALMSDWKGRKTKLNQDVALL